MIEILFLHGPTKIWWAKVESTSCLQFGPLAVSPKFIFQLTSFLVSRDRSSGWFIVTFKMNTISLMIYVSLWHTESIKKFVSNLKASKRTSRKIWDFARTKYIGEGFREKEKNPVCFPCPSPSKCWKKSKRISSLVPKNMCSWRIFNVKLRHFFAYIRNILPKLAYDFARSHGNFFLR